MYVTGVFSQILRVLSCHFVVKSALIAFFSQFLILLSCCLRGAYMARQTQVIKNKWLKYPCLVVLKNIVKLYIEQCICIRLGQTYTNSFVLRRISQKTQLTRQTLVSLYAIRTYFCLATFGPTRQRKTDWYKYMKNNGLHFLATRQRQTWQDRGVYMHGSICRGLYDCVNIEGSI